MLENLIESEPGKVLGWVEFRDGLELQVEFIGRRRFAEIQTKCTRTLWRRHQQVQELDETLLRDEFAKIIHDWRGLGRHNVRKFVMIRDDVEIPETIPFSKEGLLYIMDQASGFDAFIVQTVTDVEAINRSRLDDEKKTSGTISTVS